MPRRLLLATAVALLWAAPLAAQATPYLPLDDPDLPLLELLIQRGVLDDPAPMRRPLLVSAVARALAEAAPAIDPHDAALVARLAGRFGPRDARPWWEAGARVGAQAYSTPRRELLHPVGDAGADVYGELRLAAGFGHVVAVTRPAVEPRVTDDRDWTGRRNVDVAGRLLEGYLSAQFRYATITYGQLGHNWGPHGLPGIPLSDYGYERQGLLFELGNRTVRLTALATDLNDATDSAGATVHRYYFVHRLGVRLSDRLELAAWEGNVLAGEDRTFETRYRNPLSIGYLANTIGLGDRGNVMLGVDARWRAADGIALEGQLGVDDFWYKNRDENRDRYLFTVAASGPFLRGSAWRALYTQASSLALRAFIPEENFSDAGVGIGRNFTDMDQFALRLAIPVRHRWLVTPEVSLHRQGEGSLDDPYPVGDDRRNAPTLFIGTVERTWRLGATVSGSEGPVRLAGDVGLHRIQNQGHVAGATATELAFRFTATVGLDWAGLIPD